MSPRGGGGPTRPPVPDLSDPSGTIGKAYSATGGGSRSSSTEFMRSAASARAESPKRVSFAAEGGGSGAQTARAASPTTHRDASRSPRASSPGRGSAAPPSDRGGGASARSSRERMAELSELLTAQLITKDEFEQKRKAILDSI